MRCGDVDGLGPAASSTWIRTATRSASTHSTPRPAPVQRAGRGAPEDASIRTTRRQASQTQIGPGYGDQPMGGFVKAFVESRKPEDNVGKDLWGVPMGYYTGKDVPVYDHLARQVLRLRPLAQPRSPGIRGPTAVLDAGRQGERVTPAWVDEAAWPKRAAERSALRRAGVHPPPRRHAVALVLARPRHAARGRRPLSRPGDLEARQLRLLRPSRRSASPLSWQSH